MNHECNILAYRPLTHIYASVIASAMFASKHSLVVSKSVKVTVVAVAII